MFRNICLKLVNKYIIGDIKPVAPGKIDNLTEIVIKPPEKHFKKLTNDKKECIKKTNYKNETFDFLSQYNRRDNLILRAVPFKELTEKIGKLHNPFNVFAFRNDVSKNIVDTDKNPYYFSVKPFTNDDTEKSLYVRLYVFEDFIQGFELGKICTENIFVSDVLIDHFGCDTGARILLEPFSGASPEVKEIEICTKKNYSINMSNIFKQYLADSCENGEFVLSSNVVLDVSSNLRCFVRFQPSQTKFCVVTPDLIRDCTLTVVNVSLPEKEVLEKNEFSMSKYTTDAANYQEIIDKCLFLFVYNTKVYCKMYNVLITGEVYLLFAVLSVVTNRVAGKSGTGKSSLLKIVANSINSFPYFIYTKKINCKAIKGKTVESLHKLFTTTFFDLIHHQPSVLLLDDLQVLCENVNENDAFAQNAVYFNRYDYHLSLLMSLHFTYVIRVSEMLEQLFQKFCEHNAVGILATAESTSKLNKNIYTTRGNHLFKNVYNINELNKVSFVRVATTFLILYL